MKKIILWGVILFIGCDVSLLFAAESNLHGNLEQQQQLQQLAQLQQLQQSQKVLSASNGPPSFQQLAQNQETTSLPTISTTPNPSMTPPPFAQPNTSPAMQQALQQPPSFGPQNNSAIQQTLQQIASQNGQQLPPPQLPQTASNPDQTLAPTLVTPTTMPTTLQAPSASPSGGDDLNESAFRDMTKSTLPMSPEQIQRLRQLFNSSQAAASATPGTPPRPTATSQFVNLAPGTTPPVIRLAQGFVTSLVFIDSTGAPWPLESYDIGNPQAFNIQWNKTDNILMIQSQSLYTYGNLAVRLKGLVTPVMLTLIPGQKAVDYRVDLRIQGLGPNAQSMPLGGGIPNGANPMLLNVLDGVPPDGSRSLKLTGGEGQAWVLGDRLFLRTRLTVFSPGWMSTLSSADGMKAYEMMRTPMVLVSDHGKAVQLRLEGF